MTSRFKLSIAAQQVWQRQIDEALGEKPQKVLAPNKSFASKFASGKYEPELRRLFENRGVRDYAAKALNVAPAWFDDALETAHAADKVEILHPAFGGVALNQVAVAATFDGGSTVGELVERIRTSRIERVFVKGGGTRARRVASAQLGAAAEHAGVVVVEEAPTSGSHSRGPQDLLVSLDAWTRQQVSALCRDLARAIDDPERAPRLRAVATWLDDHVDVMPVRIEPARALGWISRAEQRLPADEHDAARLLTASAWEDVAGRDASGRLERLGEAFAVELFSEAWTEGSADGLFGWSTLTTLRRDQAIDAAARRLGSLASGEDLQSLIEELKVSKSKALPEIVSKLERAASTESTSALVDACVTSGLFVGAGVPGDGLWSPMSDHVAAEWAARSGQLPRLDRREMALAEERSLAVVAALARSGLSRLALEAWLAGLDEAFYLDAQAWRLAWASWTPHVVPDDALVQPWVDVLWAAAHGALSRDLRPMSGAVAELVQRASRRFRSRLPLLPMGDGRLFDGRVSPSVRDRTAHWPRARHHWHPTYLSGYLRSLAPWQIDLHELAKDTDVHAHHLVQSEPERASYLLDRAAALGDAWAIHLSQGRLDEISDPAEQAAASRIWNAFTRRQRFERLAASPSAEGWRWARREAANIATGPDDELGPLAVAMAKISSAVGEDELALWASATLVNRALHAKEADKWAILVFAVLREADARATLRRLCGVTREWCSTVNVGAERGEWFVRAFADADFERTGLYYHHLVFNSPQPGFLLALLAEIDEVAERAAETLHALGERKWLAARMTAQPIGSWISSDVMGRAAAMDALLIVESQLSEPRFAALYLERLADTLALASVAEDQPEANANDPGPRAFRHTWHYAYRDRRLTGPALRAARTIATWSAEPTSVPLELIRAHFHDNLNTDAHVAQLAETARHRATETMVRRGDLQVMREFWLGELDDWSEIRVLVERMTASEEWADQSFKRVWQDATTAEQRTMLDRLDHASRLPREQHVRRALRDAEYAAAAYPWLGRHPRWQPVLEADLKRTEDVAIQLDRARALLQLSVDHRDAKSVVEAWARSDRPFGPKVGARAHWALRVVLEGRDDWRREVLPNLWRAMLDLDIVDVPPLIGETRDESDAARIRRLEALPAREHWMPGELNRLYDALVEAGLTSAIVEAYEAPRAPSAGEVTHREEVVRSWLFAAWRQYVAVDALESEAIRATAEQAATTEELLWTLMWRTPERLRHLPQGALAYADRPLWLPLIVATPALVPASVAARLDAEPDRRVELARDFMEDASDFGLEIPAALADLRRRIAVKHPA